MSLINIQPAQRIQQVEEYYFSSKLKEIALMNQRGIPVINLGIGSPDGSPDESVIDALIDGSKNSKNHGYQSYVGLPEYRQAYANWYKENYSVELNPQNEILPLIGSKEGLMHIAMAFLNPGDGVLVPNPGYPAYASVSKLVGAQLISYELAAENGWQPDLEEIEKQDLSQVKLMWVNYPNMPTGQAANSDLFTKLVAFGRRNNILIVNDNPYSFILNEQPKSILAIPGALDGVLELNSLSKSHNMAGWRMGMLAGNKELLAYVLRVKSNMDSGQFKPLQLAAIQALSLGKEWYTKVNEEYAKRRKLIWELFDNLNCEYSKDQNGLFVWAAVPEDQSTGLELAEKILQEKRVFITPGFIFGSQGGKYLRASLCQPQDIIKEAIKRIKE